MNQHSLNELEAAMLKKRLKFLRAEGATGKPTYGLGDDFFKQMEDHWTFCSALADIYAVKEMGDYGVIMPSRRRCLRRLRRIGTMTTMKRSKLAIC